MSDEVNQQAASKAGPLVMKKKAGGKGRAEFDDEEMYRELPRWKLDHGPIDEPPVYTPTRRTRHSKFVFLATELYATHATLWFVVIALLVTDGIA